MVPLRDSTRASKEIIKLDIMKTMQQFHDQHVFDKSSNATYIALILKKVGALELRDFN